MFDYYNCVHVNDTVCKKFRITRYYMYVPPDSHRPVFNSSLRLSLRIGMLIFEAPPSGLIGMSGVAVPRRRRPLAEELLDSSARRRSMSATNCANERNRTSAWASVVSSSIVILSSLQYCEIKIQ